jgi:imidazolonepropionase-like amidohydrolase
MPERLILQPGRLIDGAGGAPWENPSVLIRAGRIEAVLPAGDPLPTDADVLALRSATLLPGLIDCHLHLIGDRQVPPSEWGRPARPELARKAAAHAAEALRAGVTTIRDCGDMGGVVPELRAAIDAGSDVGPHVWACAGVITTPGGHGHFMGIEAQGPAAVAQAAETLLERGADFLKVIASGGGGTPGTYPWDSQFSAEELRAAVDVAHRRGKRVCAHAHSVAAIRNCVDAGIDTLEHVTWITAEGPRISDDLVRRLAQAGAWVIPTIACYRNPVQAGIPKTFIKKIGMTGMDFVELHQRQVRRMLDAGVRVAGGTDGVQVGVGPGDIADEALYLAETAGSAQFGLQAVTGLAAAALGLEGDRGVIAAGRRADLLLVAGNPLEDMRALRRVVMVIKDGHPIP